MAALSANAARTHYLFSEIVISTAITLPPHSFGLETNGIRKVTPACLLKQKSVI
jgi:hypothetical protein